MPTQFYWILLYGRKVCPTKVKILNTCNNAQEENVLSGLFVLVCLFSGFENVEADIVQSLEGQLKAPKSLEKLSCRAIESGGNLSVYLGPRGSIVTIRLYPNGLVTTNIDYYLNEGENPLLTLEV